jgi:hypothetical protein
MIFGENTQFTIAFDGTPNSMLLWQMKKRIYFEEVFTCNLLGAL